MPDAVHARIASRAQNRKCKLLGERQVSARLRKGLLAKTRERNCLAKVVVDAKLDALQTDLLCRFESALRSRDLQPGICHDQNRCGNCRNGENDEPVPRPSETQRIGAVRRRHPRSYSRQPFVLIHNPSTSPNQCLWILAGLWMKPYGAQGPLRYGRRGLVERCVAAGLESGCGDPPLPCAPRTPAAGATARLITGSEGPLLGTA